MASKIIVVGDVNGHLSEVFGKLATLHAKQSFAFAIVAGNLFADPETAAQAETEQVTNLLRGSIEVSLPTYFALGTHDLPSSVVERLKSGDGELCPNLTILGRKVSIKTSEGFKIVAIGGAYMADAGPPISPFTPAYTDSDSLAAAKELQEADILVTSDWPSAVRDGASAAYTFESPAGVQTVAHLCSALKPRYHFSTSEGFYEREPFFHPGPSPRSITRFLSLAPFGNSNKQKWIYAFSLEPSAPPPANIPPGCTASPFSTGKKRKLEAQEQVYDNFRYSNGNSNANYQSGRERNKRQRQPLPPTPDQCFFCLSNAACETHMITSIGIDCYVTIAKGPLTTQATYSELEFPGHMLIIPLHHSPTVALISEEESRRTTVAELQRYRSALHDMLAAKSKGKDGHSRLGAVTWEISRSGGVHLHWQFLPVQVNLINGGLVEAAFDVEAENCSYPKFAKSASAIVKAEENDYLKVMIWSETLRKDMVLPLDKSFRFDLQFGRRVLAKLLGLEARMDWRACSQEKAEEDADVMRFKEAFQKFDFSLED